MEEAEVVAIQLGRPLRAPVVTESRCHLDLPVVVAVPPLLNDGTPFPTRYWLSCPLAVKRIAALESQGGVRKAEATIAGASDLKARMVAAHLRYRDARDALIPAEHTGPSPTGGVGGIPVESSGVKCLHAHYADTAAGNDNPVGEMIRDGVEPLDCVVPCVIADPGGNSVPNPDWFPPG